ncbi:MAG: hypothetical protein ABW185_28615 [Sedimenticola sp.]
MSNAERQRKYRLNRDRDRQRRADYIESEKKKYIADKSVGKRKLVENMTSREKRTARKKWKQVSQRYRASKKEEKNTLIVTPPSSPESDENAPGPSGQEDVMRMRNRVAAKCYRDNIRLRSENEQNKKKAALYKRRWTRELNRHKKANKDQDLTPRTKTRSLLKYYPKKAVRKTLEFHHALLDQIKSSYKTSSKHTEKRSITRLLSGSILQKYKMKYSALRYCGIYTRKTSSTPRIYTSLSRRSLKAVHNFYERDDVSRVTTGIKNTVTSKKIKKQRRILNDSLMNLYAMFQSEISIKISYTTFCRLRPFWVLFPTDRDRNTCLCKLCDNTQFMVSSLKKVGVTDTDDIDKLVDKIVCDSKQKECMYGDCIECGEKEITINTDKLNDETTWSEWTIKKENRTVRSEDKEVSFTVKQLVSGSIGELVEKCQTILKTYKRHVYNVRSRFKYFKERKASMQENDVIIHVDYSENYVCKLASEIQSMHFGASKKQITLHTGIFHTYANESGNTFCTVSDNLHHGPAAVWAHLNPILCDIKQSNPKVENVEIFSDGPTTQYKQKGNFYLLSTQIFDMGFSNATWNFFEPGHGKGTPDAVGGSLKRSADKKVKYGTDITSASVFVEAVKGSSTKIYEISDNDITQRVTQLEKTVVKTVSGTMKIRQVVTNMTGSISHRESSCTC